MERTLALPRLDPRPLSRGRQPRLETALRLSDSGLENLKTDPLMDLLRKEAR